MMVKVGPRLLALSLGILAISAVGVAAAAAAGRGSARAAPDYRLGCTRYGADHAAVKNLGRTTAPGGSRIEISATGGAPGSPPTVEGELHTDLHPGATWSSIAHLPRGFTACEAKVVGARPL